MKTISATPKTIREIFQSEYVIPDYQRPYSWDTYQCDQLWDDFILFHEGVKDGEQYFLGNIVVYKEDNKFFVIDGQQRLTTLLLFIKVLFNNASTFEALEVCLKKQNPLTNKLEDKLRVESQVQVHKDQENMKAIVLNKSVNGTSNKHRENFERLTKKFEKWKEKIPMLLN